LIRHKTAWGLSLSCITHEAIPALRIAARGILKEAMDIEISPLDLKQILSTRATANPAASPALEPILLDVREPWEHEAARIEDSTLMPMGDVPGRAFQELDPDAHIVAICHHGVRSLSVAAWLRNQGFEKAQSLCGGIDAWSAEIDPTVPRY
jgi:rhodanese-related sulfurtransferase